MVNHNENNDGNLNDIENDLKNLIGMRGEDRQKAINKIAFNLHRNLKLLGYKTINKKFFNSFFDNLGIASRTQQKFKKDILNYLFDKKKFSVDTQPVKTTRYLRVVAGGLMSKDDESFKVMMSKNGFKSYAYKYEFNKNAKIPTRKLLGIYDINAIPNDIINECAFIDNKTHKARKDTGVYGVVEKTIRREQNTHDALIYAIN